MEETGADALISRYTPSHYILDKGLKSKMIFCAKRCLCQKTISIDRITQYANIGSIYANIVTS